MAILATDSVTLKFGGLTAVNAVSLAVQRGEIFSVIGPNGAGKTSLFNSISGVYKPSAGKVFIDERIARKGVSLQLLWSLIFTAAFTALFFLLIYHVSSLWEAAITSRFEFQQAFDWWGSLSASRTYFLEQPVLALVLPLLLGAVLGALGALKVWQGSRQNPEVCASLGLSRTFQNVRLFPQLSAVENILIGMHRRLSRGFWKYMLRLPSCKRQEKAAHTEALALLRFVDLEDAAGRPAGALPYGFQRRLEIARALASGPAVLLLDEPAAGMNPTESVKLMGLITRIKARGVTVVLIEHDMKVVMGISDRVAVLDYGNLIAEGTPHEVRCNPKVIEAYLGAGAQHS
jgi:branched-chain amino acid transport system ATP-binding protein